jgi:hypothetical protein
MTNQTLWVGRIDMKKIIVAITTLLLSLGILAPTPAAAQPTVLIMSTPSFRVASFPYTRIVQGYGRDVCVHGAWDGTWQNAAAKGSIYAVGDVRVTVPTGPCTGPFVATWVEVRIVPSFMDPYGGRFYYNHYCPVTSTQPGAGGSQIAWRHTIDCRPRIVWEWAPPYTSYYQPGYYWFTVQVWLPVEQASFVADSPVNQVW